jgi:hypothetical protein
MLEQMRILIRILPVIFTVVLLSTGIHFTTCGVGGGLWQYGVRRIRTRERPRDGPQPELPRPVPGREGAGGFATRQRAGNTRRHDLDR